MIFFEVGEMLKWSGPMVGIQRVAFHLLKELLILQPSIKLIEYCPKKQHFVEVSLEALQKKHSFFETTSSPVTYQKWFLSLWSLRFVLYRWMKQFLPPWLKNALLFFKRRILEKSFEFLKSIKMISNHQGNSISKNAVMSNHPLLILDRGVTKNFHLGKICELARELGFNPIPLVHDIIPCFFPHFFEEAFEKEQTEENLKVTFTHAEKILTTSKSNGRDFEKFCDLQNIPLPALHFIRLGDELRPQIKNKQDPSDPLRMEKNPFFLCVSTLEPRKNHAYLFKTWLKLQAHLGDQTPDLICVGRAGWMFDEILKIVKNDSFLKKKVRWLFDVDDRTLSDLYESALASIYPSLVEGWGIPVAESLARGTPCFVSEVSSMPEVAGSFGMYFNPQDENDLWQKLLPFIQNPKLQEEKRNQIKAYQTTAWSKTAQEVLKAL